MFIRFEKCELKLEEIQKDEIPLQLLTPHEQAVIELIRNWLTKKQQFSFQTSGSTGKSKEIDISKTKIEYSCKATLAYLDPEGQFKSTLLCLNPTMIGGAMVVFRALVHKMDLHVVSPQSNPFERLGSNEYDLVSVVPLQIQQATTEQLNQFDTVLVGGAPLASFRTRSTARIFATFGMTETVSHFALRKYNEEVYECIGDARLIDNEYQRLIVQGTITNNQVLETNDRVEILSPTKFKWLGRMDFVINSGGVKLQPEEIEAKLRNQIRQNFIVSSIPDPKLGDRMILIIEGETDDISETLDFSNLSKYERPKETYLLPALELTPSGKIDRIKTRQKLLSRIRKNR